MSECLHRGGVMVEMATIVCILIIWSRIVQGKQVFKTLCEFCCTRKELTV